MKHSTKEGRVAVHAYIQQDLYNKVEFLADKAKMTKAAFLNIVIDLGIQEYSLSNGLGKEVKQLELNRIKEQIAQQQAILAEMEADE